MTLNNQIILIVRIRIKDGILKFSILNTDFKATVSKEISDVDLSLIRTIRTVRNRKDTERVWQLNNGSQSLTGYYKDVHNYLDNLGLSWQTIQALVSMIEDAHKNSLSTIDIRLWIRKINNEADTTGKE